MEELNDKKAYEMSFVAAAEEDAGRLSVALKKAGAEIISESSITRIPLSYPIEKRAEAYFGFFHFNIEPKEIAQIERQLRVQPVVLRFLIVTPPFSKSKERRQYVPRKRTATSAAPAAERKQVTHLSNEALEKQLKEILQ